MKEEHVKMMGKSPIIFAMANPNPEITPEAARRACPDAIIATGRSDYPNQINNVMCFPFLFRGTLDVRSREINAEIKMATVLALAKLAREPVPESVKPAYKGENRSFVFGPDYIVPTPFDPRLITTIPPVVAQAAMDTGVAKRPILDWELYRKQLLARVGRKE